MGHPITSRTTMSGRRRAGSKSGPVGTRVSTPTRGVPAPGLTHAVAAMAAQVEAFAKEVKDLKAVLEEVASRTSHPGCGVTTLDLDLAHFRRLRRFRLAAIVGIPLVVCFGVAAIRTLKATTSFAPHAPLKSEIHSHPPAASVSPSSSPASDSREPSATSFAPKLLPSERHAGVEQRHPAPSAVSRTTLHDSASKRVEAAPGARAPAMWRPTVADRVSAESSGGAPILD